jgi:glycosyltransferase involved in cell wall biosynthesis
MKNIWILNHYASYSSGRHYKLGFNLSKRGYSVKLFAASTHHGSGKNRITNSKEYIVDETGDLPCIFVRTRDYSGNSRARVGNMIDYAWRIMSVSKSFDTEKPDVIYASSVHPLTWLSGYFLAKRYNAKFIAETRDLWPETLVAMGRIEKKSVPARILYSLEKFIYTKADRLIFTMPGGRDYVKSLGIDTSKVAYINNGVDLEEFYYNQREHVFRDKDLDQPNTFKVVYAGSMGQANALNYLVEAAEIIQRRGIHDIMFILFGDGYQRVELQAFTEEKGLTNVQFKGSIEKKLIPSVLSRADLNVFTGQHISLYNYGLSLNKMFEYFASGKPTISNIECGYDLLEEYRCGVTVRGGSAEALADGILDFYHMRTDDYNRFCDNALVAAQAFDFSVLTDRLEKVMLD